MRVLHVALIEDWTAAEPAGRYEVSTRGRTLGQDGFIHCSTSRQLPGTLAAFYSDVDPAGLRLLVIDVPTLEAAGTPLRWDGDPAGGEVPFPHAYGPIPLAAVRAVLTISGTPGAATLPDLTGWDVVTHRPDRSDPWPVPT